MRKVKKLLEEQELVIQAIAYLRDLESDLQQHLEEIQSRTASTGSAGDAKSSVLYKSLKLHTKRFVEYQGPMNTILTTPLKKPPSGQELLAELDTLIAISAFGSTRVIGRGLRS